MSNPFTCLSTPGLPKLLPPSPVPDRTVQKPDTGKSRFAALALPDIAVGSEDPSKRASAVLRRSGTLKAASLVAYKHSCPSVRQWISYTLAG